VGNGLTVTLVVVEPEQPFTSVTFTVYVPDAAVVASLIEEFCNAELNPLGPDQLNAKPGVPPAAEEVRLSMELVQIGLLEEAVITRAAGGSVILAEAIAVHPFASVTV
jgi:hypothetical protein